MAQDLALFVAVLRPDAACRSCSCAGSGAGRATRVAAITKLFIYTLVGSLLMLAAAIATGVLVASRRGDDLTFALQRPGADRALGKGSQEWIFLCFAAAFLVKMPAFPVHGWMPDGYRTCRCRCWPSSRRCCRKVAAYGFLRVVLPLFPDAAVHFQDADAADRARRRSSTGRRWRSRRPTRGWCSGTRRSPSWASSRSGSSRSTAEGAQGAILQAVNHGLVVAPAFFIVALLAARAGGSRGHPRHGRHRVPRAGARRRCS